MTVTMQYLFQDWNCRMPGKYRDLIMDVATEEMGHVEMIATMVARLLEGAPATARPGCSRRLCISVPGSPGTGGLASAPPG